MTRIQLALDLIIEYGGIDGDHHRAWLIDQVVRELTGCPTVVGEAIDAYGNPYTYEKLGESPEYIEFVKRFEDGEDGPNSYEWYIGVPP